LLRKLDEIFELEPGTLKGEEQLIDIERWDSITVIEFLAMVGENYDDVEISPKQIPTCRTVNDLIGLVRPNA
jgi:acyl carrier protein